MYSTLIASVLKKLSTGCHAYGVAGSVASKLSMHVCRAIRSVNQKVLLRNELSWLDLQSTPWNNSIFYSFITSLLIRSIYVVMEITAISVCSASANVTVRKLNCYR